MLSPGPIRSSSLSLPRPVPLAPAPQPASGGLSQAVNTGLHDVENLLGNVAKRVAGLFHRAAPTGGGVASPSQIASALGAPQGSFQSNWPYIAKALAQAGMTDKNTIIAALATIKTETGSFQPIPEYSSGAEYNGRADLGNTQPGDGPRFKGRGYIQLTGRANYTSYGQKLGVNLVNNPDLALQPDVAAKVLVQYFKDHNIPAMAQAGNWMGVRKAVNGGLNGWGTFIGAVDSLKGLDLSVNGVPAPPDPTPTHAPGAPGSPGAKAGPGGTYTVQSGDTLSKIAQRTLGDANRWTEIYNLNRDQISDPNRIYPGQVLKLPGATPAPQPWHLDLPAVPPSVAITQPTPVPTPAPIAPTPLPAAPAPIAPTVVAPTPVPAAIAAPTPVSPAIAAPTPVSPVTATPADVTPTVLAPNVPVPVAPTPVAVEVPVPIAPDGSTFAPSPIATTSALPGFLSQAVGGSAAPSAQQALDTVAAQAEWLIENTPAQS